MKQISGNLRQTHDIRSDTPWPHWLTTSLFAIWISGGTSVAAAQPPITGQIEVDLSSYEDIQRRPGQNPDLGLAMVISGGGHRAGNAGAGAMTALEDFHWGGEAIDLLAECDYFVTHSGGGFPVAGFLVSLDQHQHRQAAGARAEDYSFARTLHAQHGAVHGHCLEQSLGRNYFANIRRGLASDLVPGGATRGEQFERSISENLLGDFRFDQVFVAKGSGRVPQLPYWFPYSTVHENGSIFVHSPDVYQRYAITGFPHGRKKVQLHGNYGAVPWCLALRASTSVPFMVPPCVLESSIDPDLPFLHLGDGALADNVGAGPALRILRQDRAKNKLLIVIDANMKPETPFRKKRSAGRIFSQIYDAVCYGMDANLHQYRQVNVTREIHRDAQGHVLCGMTADGIRVVFLYPELLPEKTKGEFAKIGPTLKLVGGQQAMLIAGGRQLVEVQREALAWGLRLGSDIHPSAPVTQVESGRSRPAADPPKAPRGLRFLPHSIGRR